MFKLGDVPMWSGSLNSQIPPENEPSIDGVMRSIQAAKDALAELDDGSVHVGTVDGVAYFWPKRMVDEMEALRSPRMERRSAFADSDPVLVCEPEDGEKA